jgi:hypothetical protein
MQHRLQRSNETLNTIAPDYSTCIYACPSAHDETAAFTVAAGTGLDVWSESHAGRRNEAARPPPPPPASVCKRAECHVQVLSDLILGKSKRCRCHM